MIFDIVVGEDSSLTAILGKIKRKMGLANESLRLIGYQEDTLPPPTTTAHVLIEMVQQITSSYEMCLLFLSLYIY
jgi:hypothetical protein